MYFCAREVHGSLVRGVSNILSQGGGPPFSWGKVVLGKGIPPKGKVVLGAPPPKGKVGFGRGRYCWVGEGSPPGGNSYWDGWGGDRAKVV